ncbi:MAG: tetratricopeptide repeat protein [Deltaproteobacteria bacterium]
MKYFLLISFLAAALISACATVETDSKQASYHYQMGLSYLGEQNITSALIELTEAEKRMPDDPLLLNSLGLAYYKKGKYDLAEQKFLKAISLKQNFSEAKNNLGLDYMAMKRWDDAFLLFKQVSEDIFYPDQETATINMARALYYKGDLDKALTILRTVVAGSPRNPVARLDLGRVYFAAGKTDLAVEQYKKSIALQANYAVAYYHLGLAYMKSKDTAAAASAFKEVLRIVPDSEIGQLSREHLEMLK